MAQVIKIIKSGHMKMIIIIQIKKSTNRTNDTTNRENENIN